MLATICHRSHPRGEDTFLSKITRYPSPFPIPGVDYQMLVTRDEIDKESNWFKKCQLIRLFHAEKQSERGSTRESGWRLKDTAIILGMSVGYVSESITIAENDSLQVLSSRKEAIKYFREHFIK